MLHKTLSLYQEKNLLKNLKLKKMHKVNEILEQNEPVNGIS